MTPPVDDGDGSAPDAAPAGTVAVETEPDPTAAAVAAEVPPEVVADSLGQYLRGWWRKLRSGDSGVVPVVVAMVVVAILFEIVTPQHSYLRPSNLVYIFSLSTIYMVLAMAEIVVLLLGEIDLSIGSVALLGGVIGFKLVQTPHPGFPWWLAILAALVGCAAAGALQGAIVALLRIPSFIVTLAGFLFFRGLVVLLLGGADASVGVSQGVPNQTVIFDLVQGVLTPAASWILVGVLVVAVAVWLWLRSSSRRRSGLVAPPASLTVIRIFLIAAVAFGVVLISVVNRGGLLPIKGMPWVIPIVLAVLGVWTFLTTRIRFGRYVYAVGGNPEAARRAGVSLPRVRITAFALCSATAGFGGILLGSFFLGQYSTNLADPGQLVLYAVAAAVIGGTSLFGGRGKPLHGMLGGLLIGAIAYGVSLLSLGTLSTPLQYIIPGAVLLIAVAVDVLSRPSARSGQARRA
jgi:D-xylose transport system permease protein